MTYLISDVHGEYALLRKLLDKIRFSPQDGLIVLGDMIDKGNDSIRTLRFLRALPNATCIVGNHEYDFLKLYWRLLREEAGDFDAILSGLQDYFPQESASIAWEDMDWLDGLPYFIEEENWIGVHAGVPLGKDGTILPLSDASREQLVYDREFCKTRRIADDQKCVFYGHTPVQYLTGQARIAAYLKPGRREIRLDHLQKVHLDTGVYLSGVLGVFCLQTCEATMIKRKG